MNGRSNGYGIVLLSATLYCIGFMEQYDEVRTLKVSRLEDVQPTDQDFEKPRDFSLARHTAGAWGIFASGKKQKVRIRFTGWAATNVREHTWHASQKITKDTDATLTAEFELTSTVEFKRWLLGFGPHAKVLSPKTLVEEVREELAAAASSYT